MPKLAFAMQLSKAVLIKNLEMWKIKCISLMINQPAFTCSKLTIETLEQGVKYVQS